MRSKIAKYVNVGLSFLEFNINFSQARKETTLPKVLTLNSELLESPRNKVMYKVQVDQIEITIKTDLTTTCLQRPPFWSPYLSLYNLNLPLIND